MPGGRHFPSPPTGLRSCPCPCPSSASRLRLRIPVPRSPRHSYRPPSSIDLACCGRSTSAPSTPPARRGGGGPEVQGLARWCLAGILHVLSAQPPPHPRAAPEEDLLAWGVECEGALEGSASRPSFQERRRAKGEDAACIASPSCLHHIIRSCNSPAASRAQGY